MSSPGETGTLENWDQYKKEREDEERSRLTIPKVEQLAMDEEAMRAHDYVLQMPDGLGGNIPTEEGGTKLCERCSAAYVVHGNLGEVSMMYCTSIDLDEICSLRRSKAGYVSIIGEG